MKMEVYGGGRRIRCETVDEAKALVPGITVVAQRNGHSFSTARQDRCQKCGALIVRLANDVYVLPKMVQGCMR